MNKESKSELAQEFDDCHDKLRNSWSVFLIVYTYLSREDLVALIISFKM